MSLLAPGIYLESTTAGGGFRHLYLVLKDGSADPHNWKVIRGGPDGLELGVTAFLTTNPLSIEESLDKYDLNGSLLEPESVSDARRAADITGKLGGIGAWNDLVSYALRLNEVYPYELPFGGEDHVANSNALILTLLNRYGVDIRTIGTLDFGDFPGAKGVDDKAATLLGAGTDRAITASPNLETGLSILGRDDVDDIITGTGFDDRLFGKEGDDILECGGGDDTVHAGGGGDDVLSGRDVRNALRGASAETFRMAA